VVACVKTYLCIHFKIGYQSLEQKEVWNLGKPLAELGLSKLPSIGEVMLKIQDGLRDSEKIYMPGTVMYLVEDQSY
jgi:hypothetical protein